MENGEGRLLFFYNIIRPPLGVMDGGVIYWEPWWVTLSTTMKARPPPLFWACEFVLTPFLCTDRLRSPVESRKRGWWEGVVVLPELLYFWLVGSIILIFMCHFISGSRTLFFCFSQQNRVSALWVCSFFSCRNVMMIDGVMFPGVFPSVSQCLW